MTKLKAEVIKEPIEKMGTNVKQTAWTSILESLATLIVGILFVIWPDTMIWASAYIIGILLLFKGLFDIMTYFMNKKNIFGNLLLSGLISALLGISALIAGPNIAN